MTKPAMNPGTRWMDTIQRYCATVTPAGVFVRVEGSWLECPHLHVKWTEALECADRAVARWERTGHHFAWPVEAGRKVGPRP